MSAISRRAFFRKAAIETSAGVLAAGVMQLSAKPLGMPIGCQTYPVRALIGQDFPGAIKQLTDAGFQTIELCSRWVTRVPASVSSPNIAGPSFAKCWATWVSNAKAVTST